MKKIGVFLHPKYLTKELFSDEFGEGDVARQVREGKYATVKHHHQKYLAKPTSG
jgi:hypothetical protein